MGAGCIRREDQQFRVLFLGFQDSAILERSVFRSKPGVYEFTAFGEPTGEPSLEYLEGPYAESTIYSIYGSQDAAVLALKTGDIDFMLNPLGLSSGLQEQLRGEPGLTTIETRPMESDTLGSTSARRQWTTRPFGRLWLL